MKINVLTEKWAQRRFTGGPLDGKIIAQPAAKEKYTHYEYGQDVVDGVKIDVMEYVYRLNFGDFVNTEINGILRDYK